MSLPARARAATATVRGVNAASRRLRVGGGTVVGGTAGLLVDPDLLRRLAAGRPTALVSGTNGKTTTTRLLAVALEGAGRTVVTNATGSNMPAGHVAALAAGPPDAPAVLEVDEGYLPELVAATSPAAVVLLNLSRDQLDRTNEVRMLAGRWRAALAGAGATTVVANADDPLVAWGAGASPRVVWVAAGLGWRLDAVGCPACDGRIVFGDPAPAGDPAAAGAPPGDPAAAGGGWSCECGFARPPLDVAVRPRPGGGSEAAWSDGRRLPLVLRIPGRFNLANAALAAAAAEALGVPAGEALGSMAGVTDVAGRFAVRAVDGVPVRLMLAKNPAGWHELLDLVCPGTGPVVVGINARVADGRDPSWLWDVPFERLRGRPVVATGERCLDLSVRLRYGEVDHATERHPRRAVRIAAGLAGGTVEGTDGDGGAAVDVVGNYTAFFDLLAAR